MINNDQTNKDGVNSSTQILIKLNILLYSLNYAEACNEFEGPIFELLQLGYTSPFEENVAAGASRWQHYVQFDRSRFELQASRSRDEHATN